MLRAQWLMRTDGLDQSLSGIDGVVVAKLAGMFRVC